MENPTPEVKTDDAAASEVPGVPGEEGAVKAHFQSARWPSTPFWIAVLAGILVFVVFMATASALFILIIGVGLAFFLVPAVDWLEQRGVGRTLASILCVGGALATVYINGPQQVFWAFPALMAVFYMVRPVEGVIFALITVFALIPALDSASNSFTTITILITILVTGSLAFAFSVITNQQRQKLMQLATRDPLTGVGNRRALENKLLESVNMFKRTATPVSLLLMDLDHFKKVNDRHGHAVGVQILKSVTEIINLRIRVTDSLYRIGGEEFLLVLPETDLDSARILAERIREAIGERPLLVDSQRIGITVSLGVSSVVGDLNLDELSLEADRAMYLAKRGGRNRVASVEHRPIHLSTAAG